MALSVSRRFVSLVLACFFALSAYVQINDPDPLQWMLLYGLVAATHFIIAMGVNINARILGAMSALYFLGGVSWFVVWRAPLGRLLFVEESREGTLVQAHMSLPRALSRTPLLLLTHRSWFASLFAVHAGTNKFALDC